MKLPLIAAVATLMVLLALARKPHRYYMLLRLGLCVGCVYYISRRRSPLAVGRRFAPGALAILYFWVIESRGAPAPLGSGPMGKF